MNKPLLSIVIANYNYGRFLEEAIQSVLSQSCNDYELIIVDGGSTDNSVEIIKKYEDKIVWWVSEKDKGQSDAFNKGFKKANGHFLTWLNADDLMLPGTLEAVAKTIKRHPECVWATGNFIRFSNDSRRIIQAAWGPHFVPKFLQGRKFPLVIYGPTTFWKKDVYDLLGGIDENLWGTMDVEYWWRLTVNGYRHIRILHSCWAFRCHENSKTEGTFRRKDNESEYISIKHNIDVKWYGILLIRVLRILDGSIFVWLVRRLFLVGRDIDYILDYRKSKF